VFCLALVAALSAARAAPMVKSVERYMGRPIYSEPATGLQLPPGCAIEPTWRARITTSDNEVWLVTCGGVVRAWLLRRAVLEVLAANSARVRFQVLDEQLLPGLDRRRHGERAMRRQRRRRGRPGGARRQVARGGNGVAAGLGARCAARRSGAPETRQHATRANGMHTLSGTRSDDAPTAESALKRSRQRGASTTQATQNSAQNGGAQ